MKAVLEVEAKAPPSSLLTACSQLPLPFSAFSASHSQLHGASCLWRCTAGDGERVFLPASVFLALCQDVLWCFPGINLLYCLDKWTGCEFSRTVLLVQVSCFIHRQIRWWQPLPFCLFVCSLFVCLFVVGDLVCFRVWLSLLCKVCTFLCFYTSVIKVRLDAQSAMCPLLLQAIIEELEWMRKDSVSCSEWSIIFYVFC